MTSELQISLKGLKFWAFHGLYEEEKILGNWFFVDLEVEIKSETISNISQTVDYGQLFEIIKQEMAITCELLETLSEKILNKIMQYDSIKRVEISIQKQRPNVGIIQGNSAIKGIRYKVTVS